MSAKRKTTISFLIALTGCLEPYQPPEITQDIGVLVIDGFVNLTDRTARVQLSRTTPVSGKKDPPPEHGATVSLSAVGSSSFISLPESNTISGLYQVGGLNLDISKKYKLRVRTSKSKVYFSDEVEFKPSPQIDSMYWEVTDDGVQIYAATHDPFNNSKYYQWDFVETFQHRSFYYAGWKVVNNGGAIVPRPPAEQVYDCWTTQGSTKILIASTASLRQDIITRFPILFIPKESIKISVTYSMLLQQRVIDENSYLFWQQLQKTSESIGGLFDSYPAQVTGNLHNESNSSEAVLGYFRGGAITTKRIFIDFKKDLPASFYVDRALSCPLVFSDPTTGGTNTAFVTHEVTSYGSCVDCRYDGGHTSKPDFWP
jgi:hypothetical protein